jgi:hypothetical protein
MLRLAQALLQVRASGELAAILRLPRSLESLAGTIRVERSSPPPYAWPRFAEWSLREASAAGMADSCRAAGAGGPSSRCCCSSSSDVSR